MGRMEHHFQRFDPGRGRFKTHVWRHVNDQKHAWGRKSSVVRVDEGWNIVEVQSCMGWISMLVSKQACGSFFTRPCSTHL